MSENAEHLLQELSKKLVDEVIPVVQQQLEEQEHVQKTPPSSLNDSFAEELLETKLISTDESSVSASLPFFPFRFLLVYSTLFYFSFEICVVNCSELLILNICFPTAASRMHCARDGV